MADEEIPRASCGRKVIDLVGHRFGRLIVTGRYLSHRSRGTRWACKCDCGNESVVLGTMLRRGSTRSCGCLQSDIARESHLSHGMSHTSIYKVWTSMVARCSDPGAAYYEGYGGRGIGVCERWRKSFPAFLADMGEKPDGLTLDRIDNDGGYELGNCRWSTPKEQNRNRRVTARLTFNGKTRPLAEWAEILSMSYNTIKSRWRKGWSPQEILFGGPKKGPKPGTTRQKPPK